MCASYIWNQCPFEVNKNFEKTLLPETFFVISKKEIIEKCNNISQIINKSIK
jgi:hypothetical protein